MQKSLEAMIHASEKSIKDLGDKADKAEVDKVNDAIKNLKDEIEKDDVDQIKEKTMKLTEAAGKIAEQAYKNRLHSKIKIKTKSKIIRNLTRQKIM